MKIGIISSTLNANIDLLLDAGNVKGHETTFISYTELGAHLNENSQLFWKQEPLNIDIAYIRGFSSVISLRTLFELLDTQGIRVVDERLIRTYDNNNKLYTYTKLQEHTLPFPPTYYAYTPDNVSFETIVKELNTEAPIIAKVGFSSQGKGVFLIKNEEELNNLLIKLSQKQKRQLLFQTHLPHDGDIRIHVIGGNAVGAMFRRKAPGEYRSNIALGATGESFELTAELSELAQKAAKSLDLEIAGVDIMLSNEKPYIVEVNRAPQFEGFIKATGIDVPEKIIEYFEHIVEYS